MMALIIGKTYDKLGLVSLITIPMLTIPIPFLAFSHSFNLALMSAILWGAVMGIHETIIRAAIADMTALERRGSAYGIFNLKSSRVAPDVRVMPQEVLVQ